MPATKRIGVDVGGTNTDGVLLEPFALEDADRGILAWHKSPTTPDPSDGIEVCITKLLTSANIDPAEIASVTIGTTHFINAVVEKDSNRLAPVAVIRLCGPFSRDCYPGIDWPGDLSSIINHHVGFVDGGLEVDGDVIRDISEEQVAEQCKLIREKGIKSVVVNGIFSPSDLVEKQEEKVGEWIAKYYPEADVVLSKHVANLGFIERENAAILNASILPFARQTIASFQRAITRLNLSCPVFLTQNDGTLLPAPLAARVPIRTFNSGPTNSMCGAAFLVKHLSSKDGEKERRPMLVVDIGGTTTDVGMLLANGLPRQASAVTDVSGVRMNFSCPDVKSIGLGGGSIVRKASPTSPLTIGPDSVGHQIQTRAFVFGGDVPTTTDYAVASSPSSLKIGDATLVPDEVCVNVEEYKNVVTGMLEGIVDRMKTNADDIDVLLVGGGAILVEDGTLLKGASKVIKPSYSGVANAIGAAIARVSGTVDTVQSTQDKTSQQVLDAVAKMAVERAVENGAYIANKARVIVKAVGDFDFSRPMPAPTPAADVKTSPLPAPAEKKPAARSTESGFLTSASIDAYKPNVTAQREWLVSELDLEWISTGCYILGTGGGGTPYPHFVRVREMMRNGSVIRVISVDDLKDDAIVACGGGKGSPTVGIEKLAGDEMMESQNFLYELVGRKPDAVIALEIGGGNGLQGLLLGASAHMNIPTVDADWMGRAYPVSWQITPVVWGGDSAQFLPQVIADGNGNVMAFHKGTTEKMIERAFRAALAEMGSHVACAKGPYSGEKTKSYAVQHTISLAWRVGRAVARCRASNELDAVADRIIDAVGGQETAKELFRGKIVGVERKTVKGHVYGEVTIAASDDHPSFASHKLKIPFKNENILATLVSPSGTESIIATVPDLICVIDSASGEAIGTPEYRYGLHVFVLGITGSDKWTSTERGVQIGGPRAFGMDVDHKPLGVFKKPVSVIDEYAPR
ncbi:hypothetical protein K488DRAFT_86866 [Vararia minispora EC-137]|uniref:Uncharacterized protein n=1 Tax=Vararia minispora EC-137 TaxID=1314806 RepID=A0ACB8QI81_9AGAM|nr:hypothetical protein K488DRAFT_86866 [Vararia minispora EC-137]